jgi:excisionase family DNA binding protein
VTPTSAAPTSGYLTTRQVADRIGATSQYVRELIRIGALDAIDLGHGPRASFRISEASVARFLADRAVRPTSDTTPTVPLPRRKPGATNPPAPRPT